MDDLVKELRRLHDEMNCNISPATMSFKAAEIRDMELQEAMAACWKAADRIEADAKRIEALEAENARLREIERRYNLFVEAMAEIKATADGESDQPVKDIVYGLLDELAALKGDKP